VDRQKKEISEVVIEFADHDDQWKEDKNI
jgi:hypothetical protein